MKDEQLPRSSFMARPKAKIDMSGGDALEAENPFAGLSGDGLPVAPTPPPTPTTRRERRHAQKPPNRGRVEVRRLKAGKGGKTVTEIRGFTGLSAAQISALGKALRQHCGTGGTAKHSVVEIQGDQRDAVCAWLEGEGFRPVRAGG